MTTRSQALSQTALAAVHAAADTPETDPAIAPAPAPVPAPAPTPAPQVAAAPAPAALDASAVRADERARIGAILDAPEAQGREAQSRALAFDTDLDAPAAIAVMAKSGKSGAAAALAAMGGDQPDLGAATPSTTAAPAASDFDKGAEIAARVAARRGGGKK